MSHWRVWCLVKGHDYRVRPPLNSYGAYGLGLDGSTTYQCYRCGKQRIVSGSL